MRRGTRRGRGGFAGGAIALTAAVLAAAPARAVQTEELHTLPVRIHVNLIDAGAGMDLAFWQGVLDRALAQSTTALQGFQGPNDVPCCTRIEPTAPLGTFGSPADGFDVVMSNAALDDIESQFGPGAYIIFSLEVCGTIGSASIVGCADTPGEFLVLDVDAPDVLGLTFAHERGHNRGLLHPGDRSPPELEDPCDLMAAANGGGCLDTLECSAFGNTGTAGVPCSCLGATAGAPPLPNGTGCSDPSGCGQCSGGLCGACTGLAGVQVLATGGSDELSTADARSLLDVSGLTGGYSSLGTAADVITGLAYDPGRDELFGTRLDAGPIAGADDLVKLDRDTGQITEIVGSLGIEDVIALAYDPGADVLYAIQLGDEIFGMPAGCVDCVSTLYQIDPDDANTAELGVLNFLILPGGVDGLAYDTASGTLFGSTGAGLFTIDPACTGGMFPTCSTQEVDKSFVSPGSLGFDPATGTLVRAGLQFGSDGFYQTLDPGTGNPADPETGESLSQMGVRDFTPGGLTVLPASEPAEVALRLAGIGTVVLLAFVRLRRR